MLARQIAARPEPGRDGLKLFHVGRLGHHDDESRQVLVERAQSVGSPGAQARPAGDLVARLGEGDGRFVVDGVGVHAADETHFVDHLGRVRQQFADPHAALAVLGELVFRRRDGEPRLAAGHRRQPLALADGLGQVLVVPGVHLRLVVVEIDLRRAADHVQVDDVLGLAGEVGTGQVRTGGRCRLGRREQAAAAVGAQERDGRRAAQRANGQIEKTATRRIDRLGIIHLFNTSSRFISSFVSIVQAASVGGSSFGSAGDSPTVKRSFAPAGFAL